MSATLRTQKWPKGVSDYVVWTTINDSQGHPFNVQVQVDMRQLEHAITRAIDSNPAACGLEVREGNTIIRLTRQS